MLPMKLIFTVTLWECDTFIKTLSALFNTATSCRLQNIRHSPYPSPLCHSLTNLQAPTALAAVMNHHETANTDLSFMFTSIQQHNVSVNDPYHMQISCYDQLN